MNKKKIASKALLPIALMGVASQLHAQAPRLEEIIVTAQKTVTMLQETPISMTAVTGEKLQEAGIARIEELQGFVPNLQMTETGISTQIYIRGIGTGNNQGFEQSVGQYIDGIYYGRQQLLRAPFMDMEQVEILRGPQSILFGKNSIAGAMSLMTGRPKIDFEGVASLAVGDYGMREVNLMMTGGITENVSARFAYRHFEEDGFVTNTFKGVDEPRKDDDAIRLVLSWTPDDWEIRFKAERDTFDTDGRQIDIIQDDIACLPFDLDPSSPIACGQNEYVTETPPIPGATFSQILGLLGHPGGITETELDYNRQADGPEFSYNELFNYTLIADYDWNDYTVSFVTGYVGYEFTEECDCDFIGAPVFTLRLEEEYKQLSQEFRIVSPGDETIDWIGGLFFQTSELDYNGGLTVPSNSVLAAVSPALAPLANNFGPRNYQSDSDLWAIFAQVKWNVTDEFNITVGARYTEEDKDASRIIEIYDLDTNQPICDYAETGVCDSIAPTLWFAVFGVQNEQFGAGHNLSGSRNEGSFTPLITAQWDVTESTMLYATYTTGFKAGGFDARANNVDSWEFENEDATTVEIGSKHSLLDGAMELNISLYHTQYDDLQIAQFDGTLGFNVGNAAETTVQGVEVDMRWALTENLTATSAFAYLDHTFDDFRNGNCYNRQTPDGVVFAGLNLCDYTGKSGQYTPETSGFLTLDHEMELGSGGWTLKSTLDLVYSAKHNVHVNLDPAYTIDGYTKVNVRAALRSESWELAVRGDNITDEDVLTYVGNTPLSGSTFGTNTYYGFLARPKMWSASITYFF